MKRFLLFYIFLPASFACNQVLKVGADFGWPPYSYIEEGEIIGLDIEITRHVFSSLDYCVQFVSMPSATRAIEEIKNAKVDLVVAASYSEERAALGIFSIPYRFETIALFTHLKSGMDAASISVLFQQGATFAVNRGSYNGNEFRLLTQRYQEQVIYLNTAEQRFLLLNSGRVHFVVEDLYAGNYLAKHNSYNNILQTKHVVYQNPVHFLVSKVGFSQKKVTEVNQAIRAAKTRINELNSNYLPAEQVYRHP